MPGWRASAEGVNGRAVSRPPHRAAAPAIAPASLAPDGQEPDKKADSPRPQIRSESGRTTGGDARPEAG